MASDVPEHASSALEEEVTYCHGHPDTPTKLRCSRCDRPICGRCAIPATVGQHCPWCLAEARRSAPRIRSTMAANAPVVLAIVVVNAAFFLAQRLDAGITLRLGAIPAAIAAGQWYRLLTPMLLHANILHIGLNMFVLWIYGPYVEQAFGRVRFLAVYVVSGFMGGALSFALGPCRTIGVGASGAIFGVVGALLVHLYNRRRSSFVAGYLRDLVGFVVLNLLIGFVLPQIDYLAHLGGLAGGVALGVAYDRAGSGALPAGAKAIATAAVVGAGLALVMWRAGQGACL
ncbi:MAG TPA: rhomboid family intramembrane serine protease [Actinomycetota bacterium]|nr:rhomboid family intramembrane serine protease [Actinomycetota bacterium]